MIKYPHFVYREMTMRFEKTDAAQRLILESREDKDTLIEFIKTQPLDLTKAIVVEHGGIGLNVKEFTQGILSALAAEKLSCHLCLQDSDNPPNQDALAANKQLLNYYRYMGRQRQGAGYNPQAVLALLDKPVTEPKVRRPKLMMKRQVRLRKQTHQQFHRQQAQHTEKNYEQALQRNQQAQQQRQAQRQQYKARQQLVMQQQARMQPRHQAQPKQGFIENDLIGRDDLQRLVNEAYPLERLNTIWDRLVGQHNQYVEDENNRITHVPLTTMQLILAHEGQFSGGIHFDDLPNGFAFDVLERVIQNRARRVSVLYYDKSLEKHGKERLDSPLAPQLITPLTSIKDFGDVGQFFPFIGESLDSYEVFCQRNQAAFGQVFYPGQHLTITQRQDAFITLMCLDNPALITMKRQLKDWLNEFSDNNINGLRTVFITTGADTTVQLLAHLQQLKNTNQYESFKTLFLDKLDDWRPLVREKTTHPDALSGFQALNYLASMPATERVWWQAVSSQHVQKNLQIDVIDLINSLRYFFEQIKAIDNKLILPSPCPLQNIINMKAVYRRVLFVLRKAIDPFEQAKHLNQDWSMQGAICASRAAGYVFVHEKMELTPASEIVGQEELRSLFDRCNEYNGDEEEFSYRVRVDYGGLRDRLIRIYKNFIKETKQNPEFYILPDEFFSPIYEKVKKYRSLYEVNLNSHYGHTEEFRLWFLTRDDAGEVVLGCLREVFSLNPYQPQNGHILALEDQFLHGPVYTTIYESNIPLEPKYSDKYSILAAGKNKLNYPITLPQLYAFSKSLSSYKNICRYFYRFIGTEPYAFSFDTYEKITDLLDVINFEETLIRLDKKWFGLVANEYELFQKNLIPLLAATTTGKRALKAQENHQFLLEELISYLAERINNENYKFNYHGLMSDIFYGSFLDSINGSLNVHIIDSEANLSAYLHEEHEFVLCTGGHEKQLYYIIDKKAHRLHPELAYKMYNEFTQNKLMNTNTFDLIIFSTSAEREAFQNQISIAHLVDKNPEAPIKLYRTASFFSFCKQKHNLKNGYYSYWSFPIFTRISIATLIYVDQEGAKQSCLEKGEVTEDCAQFIKNYPFNSVYFPSKEFTQNFIQEIKKLASKESLFECLNRHLSHASTRPLLSEVISLIKLPITHSSLDFIFQAVNLHQAIVYRAFMNLQQNDAHIDLIDFNDYCEKLTHLQGESSRCQALILLSSFLTPIKQSSALLAAGDNSLRAIHLEVISHLIKLLSQVNVLSSKPILSEAKIHQLFKQLARIPADEPHKKACVYAMVQQTLPELKLGDTEIANALVLLIRTLAPFGRTLEELVSWIDGHNFSMADAGGDTALLPEDNRQFLFKVVQGIKGAVLTHIRAVLDPLNAAADKATEENIKNVLEGIQALVEMVEKPFNYVNTEGFSLGDKFKLRAAEVLLTPFIQVIKKQVVQGITKHLHEIYSLQLTTAVDALHIDDNILNQAEEKEVLLSVQLAGCLIQQLPDLPGQNMTFELNRFFKVYEALETLLNHLKHWPKRQQRDAFLRELYRQGYFNRKPLYPNLHDLSEIVIAVKGFAQLDIMPFMAGLMAPEHDIETINALLKLLVKHQAQLSQVDLQPLIHLGLKSAGHGVELLGSLLAINELFQSSSQAKTIKNKLLEACRSTEQLAGLLTNMAALKTFVQTHLNHLESMASFICYAAAEPNQVIAYLHGLSQAINQANKASDLLLVLNNGCWQHATERRWTYDEQLHFIEQFKAIPPAYRTALVNLYQESPAPALSSLQNALNEQQLGVWLTDIELDPFGNKEKISQQLGIHGVEAFANGIKTLPSYEVITAEQRRHLLDGYAYILAITDKYCLTTTTGFKKQLKHFKRDELRQHYQMCVKRVQQNPRDLISKLEILAVLGLAMFRTTGKYPYFSQLLGALTTVLFPGHLMQQIPTGQGKGITNALIAALNFSFGGSHVSVTSRFQYLVERDFKENCGFFKYLQIPVALISAATEENYFIKPTVKYATAGGESLYRSKLKAVDHFQFPPQEAQTWVGDEGDCDLYDNKNAFNFSESEEDPYFNPLEWAYPLVNDFIDSALFQSEAVMEAEDIYFLSVYLQDKAPDAFEMCRERLTAAKLDQLINAACTAKTLVENDDYIIREKTREVYGRIETISQAHVLVNHAEDTEATLSYGVQQCLHARLSVKYAQAISNWKKGGANNGPKMPPFPCDNQIDCIDSQHYFSYLKQFGRRIATTGTAGAPVELLEAQKALGFAHILLIPPRLPGLRKDLGTIFSDDNAAFYFSPNTQTAAIKRLLAKARHQPVLINSQSIEKAEFFKAELERLYPNQVQVIHAKVAENEETFAQLIAKAKDPGMITIITPLAARGADIKPQKGRVPAKPSPKERQIADLAEVLLTIETYLERYRERMQFQGRTARDERRGETVGVFDLAEIEQTHGMDLRPLTREEKLACLDKLRQRLDNEAALERIISTAAKQLALDYTNQFDAWLNRYPAKRHNILAAKTRFIEEADSLWALCLAAIDPNNQYPNPYVRYDEQGQLTDGELRQCLSHYETRLKESFKTCCELMQLEIADEGVEKSYTYRYQAAENLGVLPGNQPAVSVILPASIYAAYQQQVPHDPAYLIEVKLTAAFRCCLAAWLQGDEVSSSVKGQAFLFQQAMDSKLQQADACFPISYLQTLMERGEALEFDIHAFSELNYFSALAMQDAYFDAYKAQPVESFGELTIQQQTKLIDASLKFVGTMLEKALHSSSLNALEKTKVRQLSQRIGQLQSTNLHEIQALILSGLTLLQHSFSNPKLTNFITSLKTVVDAACLKGGTEPERLMLPSEEEDIDVIPEDIQTQQVRQYVKLMSGEITFFLEQAKARLDKPIYRLMHPFAQQKIEEISQFLMHLNKVEIQELFIAENATKPPKDLLRIFADFKIKGLCLNDILSFNTTTGSRHGQTQSKHNFDHLCSQWQKTLGAKNYDAYLKTLQGIGRRLVQRQKNAGFFKDHDLYDRKVAKFNLYYQQIEQLIRNKDKQGIADIDSELMSLQLRIKHDPDLAVNTSLLFKLAGNVTVVNEITAATRKYLIKA